MPTQQKFVLLFFDQPIHYIGHTQTFFLVSMMASSTARFFSVSVCRRTSAITCSRSTSAAVRTCTFNDHHNTTVMSRLPFVIEIPFPFWGPFLVNQEPKPYQLQWAMMTSASLLVQVTLGLRGSLITSLIKHVVLQTSSTKRCIEVRYSTSIKLTFSE